MKNYIKSSLLLFVICNAGFHLEASSSASQSDHHQTMSGWMIRLDSKCKPEIHPDHCVAGTGFAIRSNLQFETGPDPQGRTKSGVIPSGEFQELQSEVRHYMLYHRAHKEQHRSIPANETDDTIRFQVGETQSQVIVRTEGTDLMFRTSSEDRGKKLLSSLRMLAIRYY